MNRNQENYAVGDDGSSRRGQKKKTTGGPGKEKYGATVRMRINLKNLGDLLTMSNYSLKIHVHLWKQYNLFLISGRAGHAP